MSKRAHEQEDVEDVILEVLELGQVRTTQELYSSVKKRLNLFPEDLRRANKRDEQKIDQIIANALQAKRRLCRDGLIERVAVGEFKVTHAGKAYLIEQREMVANASKLLDDLFPDADRG